MTSEITATGMASLLEHVVSEAAPRVVGTVGAVGTVGTVGTTAERFGCGAHSEQERRACSLYLWLLGPTTKQLTTDCPCRH